MTHLYDTMTELCQITYPHPETGTRIRGVLVVPHRASLTEIIKTCLSAPPGSEIYNPESNEE